MKRQTIALMVATAMIAGTGISQAAETKAEHKVPRGKGAVPLTTMTCQEFLLLDHNIQPLAVYWLDGYRKGQLKTSDEDVGMVSLDRPISAVVNECKRTPKETLWHKIKSTF